MLRISEGSTETGLGENAEYVRELNRVPTIRFLFVVPMYWRRSWIILFHSFTIPLIGIEEDDNKEGEGMLCCRFIQNKNDSNWFEWNSFQLGLDWTRVEMKFLFNSAHWKRKLPCSFFFIIPCMYACILLLLLLLFCCCSCCVYFTPLLSTDQMEWVGGIGLCTDQLLVIQWWMLAWSAGDLNF